ncbi:MAG: alternative ribosome rescue aminoacyl-tRNA hydrolase ArfB [Planctomycetota bacterium]|jgi:ribosome-associated protein
MIEITKAVKISEDGFVFKASRSSGPGGQHVNKVNTRITLFFDVANCSSFSDSQKERILRHLSTRASKAGVLRIVSQRYRSQKANRELAVQRLVELLRGAIQTKPTRKKTKIPQTVKRRRLEEKKRRSILKQQRAKKDFSDELLD